jgi:hypothetical protein
MKDLDFSTALCAVRASEGYRLARRGWNGKNMWIAMRWPNDREKMTLPYLYLRTADGDFVPWLASQADLFAEDWEII